MPAAIPEVTNTQIVQLLSEGFVVKEISVETKTNVRTIESRISKLKEVTGAKTAAHLVAKYFVLGLITAQ